MKIQASKTLMLLGLFGVSAVVVHAVATPFTKMELVSRNYSLLSSNDTKGWNIRLSQAKAKDSNQDHYSSLDALKSRCDYLLMTSFSGIESSNSKEAISFCTRPETFLTKAKTSGKKIIDLKGEEEVWKQKVQKYSDDYSDSSKRISIIKDALAKDDSAKHVLKSDMDILKLRIWCQNKGEIYTEDNKDTQDKIYPLYETYCTTEEKK